MILKILGSASGIPTASRFNSALVLQVKNGSYMFDCGEPASALMIRQHVDYNRIRAIFISHMDADHVAGIAQLVQTMTLSGRSSSLVILVPREGLNPLKAWLEAVYLVQEVLSFPLEIYPMMEGSVYKDELVEVSALSNSHLVARFSSPLFSTIRSKYFGRTESYSFLVQAGEKRMVYSGDITCIEELHPFFDRKMDLLIVELAHVDPESVFAYLEDQNVERIVLTHLHPGYEGKETEILSMCKPDIRHRVSVARDGMQLEA